MRKPIVQNDNRFFQKFLLQLLAPRLRNLDDLIRQRHAISRLRPSPRQIVSHHLQQRIEACQQRALLQILRPALNEANQQPLGFTQRAIQNQSFERKGARA